MSYIVFLHARFFVQYTLMWGSKKNQHLHAEQQSLSISEAPLPGKMVIHWMGHPTKVPENPAPKKAICQRIKRPQHPYVDTFSQ